MWDPAVDTVIFTALEEMNLRPRSLTIAESNGLQVATKGVTWNQTSFTIAMTQPEPYSRMQPTPVSYTEPIGAFFNSSIYFEPFAEHDYTTINVSFVFNADLVDGDAVSIHLPGFTSCRNGSIALTGDNNAVDFAGSWSGETLLFVATTLVAANTSVELFVDLGARIQFSEDGVLYYESGVRISSNCTSGSWFGRLLLDF